MCCSVGLFSALRVLHPVQDFIALVDSRPSLLLARNTHCVVEVADDRSILELELGREIKLGGHAAEGPGGDRAARSGSAVVSVRASFGRSRQSRVLSSGANEDGRRSGLSSGAAEVEDSYRFAAFSHEFRNLRKSSRVSLSAASCARAAHSAAFCLQYPI